MIFTRISLALLLLFSMPTFVGAQNQHEMNQEAAKSAEVADKQLNVVYKKVMDQLDDEGKALLKASQRAWLAFRDADAKLAADEMRGGSAAPLLFSGTMARLTKERTARLRQMLGEDAAETKVTYKKCVAYAGSSRLFFENEAGEVVEVSVMNKVQRTGMAEDEPYVKYPEKMIKLAKEGPGEANPAMVGKPFLLVKNDEGEVTEIKPAE